MRPRRNRFRARLVLLVFATLLALARAAGAHDIWLHADDFSLDPGDTLIVRQLVGTDLRTDMARLQKTRELPVLRDLTTRFSLIADSGSIDLLAELPPISTRAEVQPVLKRRLDSGGLVLVAMDHGIIYTEHTNDEFLEYLEHEELARDAFETQMESGPAQTEGYQRTLKSLARVGTCETAPCEVYNRVLGQPLELVLLENPFQLDPGDTLAVQLLFQGKPLADQLVKAYNSNGERPASVYRERTNAEGIARFDLARAGLWLLRLVYLIPCSPRSQVDCEDAAWESYWTAYSFELD